MDIRFQRLGTPALHQPELGQMPWEDRRRGAQYSQGTGRDEWALKQCPEEAKRALVNQPHHSRKPHVYQPVQGNTLSGPKKNLAGFQPSPCSHGYQILEKYFRRMKCFQYFYKLKKKKKSKPEKCLYSLIMD